MIKKRALKWIWNRKLRKIKENNCFETEKNIFFQLEEVSEIEMIALTGIFHGLKSEHFDLKIAVIASKEASEFIKNNPYIDRIYIYDLSWKEIQKVSDSLQKENYSSRITPQRTQELKRKYNKPELYPMDHYIYRAQGYRAWLGDRKMIVETQGREVRVPRSEGIQDVIALIYFADEVKTDVPLIEAIVSVFEEEKIDKKME